MLFSLCYYYTQQTAAEGANVPVIGPINYNSITNFLKFIFRQLIKLKKMTNVTGCIKKRILL